MEFSEGRFSDFPYRPHIVIKINDRLKEIRGNLNTGYSNVLKYRSVPPFHKNQYGKKVLLHIVNNNNKEHFNQSLAKELEISSSDISKTIKKLRKINYLTTNYAKKKGPGQKNTHTLTALGTIAVINTLYSDYQHSIKADEEDKFKSSMTGFFSSDYINSLELMRHYSFPIDLIISLYEQNYDKNDKGLNEDLFFNLNTILFIFALYTFWDMDLDRRISKINYENLPYILLYDLIIEYFAKMEILKDKDYLEAKVLPLLKKDSEKWSEYLQYAEEKYIRCIEVFNQLKKILPNSSDLS